MSLQYDANGDILVANSTAVGTVGSLTMLVWLRINNNVTRQQIIRQVGTPDWEIQYRGDLSGKPILVSRQRATAYQEAWAPSGNFSAWGIDKWVFVAGVIDLAGLPKIYVGDVSSLASEPSSYTTQASGLGTASTTNADINIGNFSLVNTRYIRGEIAWVGVWDRPLTQDEIRNLQFYPRITNGCVYFCHLGVIGSASQTQPDYSGGGAHGTPTGLALSDDPPINFWQSEPIYVYERSDVTLLPSPQSLIFSLPAASVNTDWTQPASVQTAQFSVPAYSVFTGTIVAPATQSLQFSSPAPSIRTDWTQPVTIQSSVLSLPAASVNTDWTQPAPVETAQFSIPAYQVLTGAPPVQTTKRISSLVLRFLWPH
ncbi:MAG: LamG-like jellyroll fold domain-containing protein [bacterium JZ-2024 1]